jgi:hypothetical protein
VYDMILKNQPPSWTSQKSEDLKCSLKTLNTRLGFCLFRNQGFYFIAEFKIELLSMRKLDIDEDLIKGLQQVRVTIDVYSACSAVSPRHTEFRPALTVYQLMQAVGVSDNCARLVRTLLTRYYLMSKKQLEFVSNLERDLSRCSSNRFRW